MARQADCVFASDPEFSLEGAAIWPDRLRKKTRRLVADGVLVRAERGYFDLAASVRNYVKHLRDTSEVDGETLAMWLGLQPRAVRLLAHNNHVVKSRDARNRYSLKDSIKKYCEMLRYRAGIRASDDDPESRLDNIAESAALKRATRELIEIKRDALAKKLISIEELTDAWSEIVRQVRQLGVSITARFQERAPHLKSEDFGILREIVREVMNEAAELTPEAPPIPSGGEADCQPPIVKRKRGRPPGPSRSLRP
jgi:phage terminase Nu1 subunit (DNA packaging protein)